MRRYASFFSFLLIALLVVQVTAVFAGDVHVRGYTRKDGTYVAPHYRSAPDGNVGNNYSTRGNVNPYTGQPGRVNPYSTGNGSTLGSFGNDGNLSGFGSRRGYGR